MIGHLDDARVGWQGVEYHKAAHFNGVINWVQFCFANGYKLAIELLELCQDEMKYIKERKWIHHYVNKGYYLVNGTHVHYETNPTCPYGVNVPDNEYQMKQDAMIAQLIEDDFADFDLNKPQPDLSQYDLYECENGHRFNALTPVYCPECKSHSLQKQLKLEL